MDMGRADKDLKKSLIPDRCKSHLLFCPSSSYLEEDSEERVQDTGSYFIVSNIWHREIVIVDILFKISSLTS